MHFPVFGVSELISAPVLGGSLCLPLAMVLPREFTTVVQYNTLVAIEKIVYGVFNRLVCKSEIVVNNFMVCDENGLELRPRPVV
jgi:hypothetical protein